MTFYISPSVSWSEQDDTLYPQEISDNIGALAGTFQWGPVDHAVLITDGEEGLERRFYKPNDSSYLAFMVASDFFSYSKKAHIIRVAGPLATNAVPEGQTAIRVNNENAFESVNTNGYSFVAKYPGSLGNGLTVSIADHQSFDNWEYRNDFEYAPRENEYSIAIIDGSGAFTGAGATKQAERLVVGGKVSGGINQQENVVISGQAEGGKKQQERLSIRGTATDTQFEIAGITVELEVGDSQNTVALKIAAELRDNPTSPFEDVYSANNTVFVTHKTYGLKPAINASEQSGIVATSTVTISGNDNFFIYFRGKQINLVNGESAEQSTSRIVSALLNDKNTFKEIVSNSATEFQFEYVEFGKKDVELQEEIASLSFVTTILTAGDDKVNVEVFGETVQVLNGDTQNVVAQKIGAVLETRKAEQGIENISVSRNTVSYSYPAIGAQKMKQEPETQNNVTFNMSVIIPGRLGTVLEKFEILNNIPGSRFEDGSIQYFADAINQRSRYVYVGDVSIKPVSGSVRLEGGLDDYNVNPSSAYQRFLNSEEMDVNYLIDCGYSVQIQKTIADVATTRRDCFAFISPQIDDVLNNQDREVEDCVNWSANELNKETSYLIKDCNWAYVYDRWNDKYRWIPCSGGTAGLKARTDSEAEPWVSPAGYEYGRYKNYIRLAWSPDKAQRDELYKRSINPVVSFKAEGILLYGDKTSLTRPSAFQAINIRSAFIVAQKTLANFAKYYLFKNNDEYTRAQFTNACRPFLRNMTGRGAWEDVRFVSDETNNTSSVRRERKLKAKIMIKPLYSINYVDLMFVAVNSEVSFDEIE